MKQSSDSLTGLFTCRLVPSVGARPQDPVTQVSDHIVNIYRLPNCTSRRQNTPCITEDVTYLATVA